MLKISPLAVARNGYEMLTLCCKLFSATLVLPLPSVCLIW